MAILLFVILVLAGIARADSPSIDLRLVADSGGATFHMRDGRPLQLGPSLLPLPLGISRVKAAGSAVQVMLATRTAKSFEDATGRNQGRRLAIVVGGIVQCAPLIKAPIVDGNMLITLDSAAEAAELARSLTTK